MSQYDFAFTDQQEVLNLILPALITGQTWLL